MEITDIRIRKINTDSRLKAVASITIDNCFAIHELRVIEGKEGLFVAMPSRQVSDGTFKDIAHPINAETRKLIEDFVVVFDNKDSQTDHSLPSHFDTMSDSVVTDHEAFHFPKWPPEYRKDGIPVDACS